MSKKEEKKLVDEYLDHHRTLVKQYGPQSVVLLQNGSFFEIYNYRLKDGPDLYMLADLLNIQVSRRDKKDAEVSQSNYEMAGFPLWAKQKFVQIFLNANYTVAIYVQVEQTDKKKGFSRILDEVISPSTNIDYLHQVDNNYLMSIYIDAHKTQKERYYSCGYSFIDLSVGRNYLYESGSQPDDFEYGLDKIYQSLKVFNPREIVIHLNDSSVKRTDQKGDTGTGVITKEQLWQHLELDIDNRTVHFFNDNRLTANYSKVSFQNQFLEKIFPNHGMLSPIEYLDLEKYPNAIISYLILLEFAKSHRTNIVDKISKPEILEETSKMTLTLNSVYQLAVVPDKNQDFKKNNSLLGILNNCSTAIGKRMFKHRLLHPITNIEQLEEEYNQIDQLYQNDRFVKLRVVLHQILDLERMHRRLALGILYPNEFYGLHKSNLAIRECQDLLKRLDCEEMTMPEKDYEQFQEYMDYYCDILDVKAVFKYNLTQIERSIFVRGNYPEIDELEDSIQEMEDKNQAMTRQLSRLIDGKEDMITLDNNDKEGYFFTLTNKRADTLKEKLKKWSFHWKDETFQYTLDHFTFKKGANSCKLFHKDLKRWGEEMSLFRQKMCRLCQERYCEVLKQIEDKYFLLLRKIVKFIAHLDVVKTNAQNIQLFNLTRPKLDQEDGPSYLAIEGVRHLIVEQIQKKTPFVTNDVFLGKGQPHNVLCYGYNAVGKTTLQKSICLAVIMAQSGGYVPASSMRLRPYNRLFTRISNVDNLLKGQSSYMVEMLELKYILKHADAKSLVCIDELVASTESYSGISSVVATLKILHDRNVSMFMATHLHQLATMSRVKELKGLTIKHLEVFYDGNTQELIYDRKLKDGPGSGLYGLEVSRYLDLPKEFLDLAFEVRNELLDKEGELQIIPHKTSSYNSNVVVDQCQICAKNASQLQLDVHHINFQCHADQHGNFESFHKNVDHNLVVLCKTCHIDVHSERITLRGYRFTSKGVKLDYTDHRERQNNKADESPSTDSTDSTHSTDLTHLTRSTHSTHSTHSTVNNKDNNNDFIVENDDKENDKEESKSVKTRKSLPTQTKRSKYTDLEKEDMRDFLKTVDKTTNKKFLLDRLYEEKGYKISYKTLNQVLS